MLETIMLRYVLPMFLAASLASYATHKIVVNSYAAEELAKEKAAEKNKTVVDSKLNTVETVYETTIKEVEKIKYVTKTEWQTEYKDVFVYTNTECSLPDSGIKLLDDYSAKLNATRKVQ